MEKKQKKPQKQKLIHMKKTNAASPCKNAHNPM